MKVGLNLYSIRTLISNEADFLSTAEKLRDMGYSYLQYSGAELIPDRIKRVSEASGLPIYLTHVPLDRIINDTDRLMEDHSVFGCKNIGLGGTGAQAIIDKDNRKKMVEALNAAAEKMQKNGFNFFMHNHHYEFFRHDDECETFLDYVLKNAPAINFTLDTYWAHFGGADVIALLDKLKGKVACVHLKDYRIGYKTDEEGRITFAPKFAPVGEGSLNMKAIVDKMKLVGTKYFFVEQDDACTEYDDPLGEVERSIKYIAKEL